MASFHVCPVSLLNALGGKASVSYTLDLVHSFHSFIHLPVHSSSERLLSLSGARSWSTLWRYANEQNEQDLFPDREKRGTVNLKLINHKWEISTVEREIKMYTL